MKRASEAFLLTVVMVGLVAAALVAVWNRLAN
jgi:hypothetical protein